MMIAALFLFAVPLAADCYPEAGTPVSVHLVAPSDPQVGEYAVIRVWKDRAGMLRVRGHGTVTHRLNPSVQALAFLLFRTMTPDEDGHVGEYAVTTRCEGGRLRTEYMPNGTWMLFFLRNHFALEGL